MRFSARFRGRSLKPSIGCQAVELSSILPYRLVRSRFALVLLVLCCLAVRLCAQRTPPATGSDQSSEVTFRSATNLVLLDELRLDTRTDAPNTQLKRRDHGN